MYFPMGVGPNLTQSHCRSQDSCGIFFGTQVSKNIHVVKAGEKANKNDKVYFLQSLINVVLGDAQSYNMSVFCFCFANYFVIYIF